MARLRQVKWQVEKEQAGERLDKIVTAYDEEWSRNQVQEWIDHGWVQVNGKVRKGSYRPGSGEWIEVELQAPTPLDVLPEEIPLDIRYEDGDLLVVNKPRGMVVHPGSGHQSGTLVSALLAYCPGQLSGIGGVARPGIVHRIDKDTSGLLMVAKNDFTHQVLSKQLKAHTVGREYMAIVHGVLPHDQGRVDAPIARDIRHRQQMAVSPFGKHAVTHFTVCERFLDTTWIKCVLETGRTHQIRVHMKYIGFPLVGDPVYGPVPSPYPIKGQALHAKSLSFTHPRTGKRISIEADIPSDMTSLLRMLRDNHSIG